jgi:hypothetical protein
MDIVRTFTPDDIPAVAALFERVFRHRDSPPPAGLLQYIDSIYFHNPLYTDEQPSFVYDADGKIGGFIGVLPFPFEFEGVSVRAAIGGNYMVDPGIHNPLAGVKVLRAFFAGKQDVALTDTSNEVGRKMWGGMGGVTLQLYSLLWLRVLRPAGFGRSLLSRSRVGATIALFSRPIAPLIDAVATGIDGTPLREEPSGLHEEQLTPASLLESFRKVAAPFLFRPAYTEEYLSWLISMARQKREYGDFASALLRDDRGAVAGWYMYYPNPGEIGQVLQLCAMQGKLDSVMAHLFEDARVRGSVGLIGRGDANALSIYTAHNCLFFQRSMYTQVNTRRQDVLQALHTGKAFLTRLEGEWWTRLQGDSFEESVPAGPV